MLGRYWYDVDVPHTTGICAGKGGARGGVLRVLDHRGTGLIHKLQQRTLGTPGGVWGPVGLGLEIGGLKRERFVRASVILCETFLMPLKRGPERGVRESPLEDTVKTS